MIHGVLAGGEGPARHVVLLNAGAAIYVAGLAETLQDGVQRAAEAIDSGAASRKLADLVAFTQQFA